VAVLVAIFEIVRRRHKRLTSEGQPVAGYVERVHRRAAGSVYVLRFQAGGGQGHLRGRERSRKLRPGDALTVLHDRKDPAKALIYRQSLYRAL
jgi:hypothetical protein